MNSLQSWMIVGIPSLVVLGALFVGASTRRAMAGYGVLAATVLFFVLVPGDTVSAAVIGLIGFGFVASGRGSYVDDERPEHHENRTRFTTDPSHN